MMEVVTVAVAVAVGWMTAQPLPRHLLGSQTWVGMP